MSHPVPAALGTIAVLLASFLLQSGCTRDAESSARAPKDSSAALVPPSAATHAHEVPSPNGARNDEYYWLRDDTRKSDAVLSHLRAENAYADAMLAHTKPLQSALYDEIVARIQQDDSTVPYEYRGHWYYRRFEAGKEYPIHARKAGSLQAPEQVMLDVNRLAEGHGFFEVGNWSVSPDGKLLAWAEDSVGRRQYTLRVKSLATGAVLAEQISNVAPAIAWAADNRTLLYVAKDPVTLLANKVRKHVLGTDAAKDPLVYEETDNTYYTFVGKTRDDEFLTIISNSTTSSEVRVARADDPRLRFKPLIARERDHEYQAEHLGKRWILRTNWQAKNYRIVAVDEADLINRDKWRDVLPHRTDAFVDGYLVFQDFLAVQEHSNGLSNIRIARWNGGEQQVIASDEPAYAARLSANPSTRSKLLRYTYTSLTTPATVYDYEVASGAKTLLKREAVLGGFDQAQYVTEHLWASARDGTKVPVSLVYRKGTPQDGTAPLLQLGYGSYGNSLDPGFSHSIISLLDRGFVYAIAHVRGGQEMGRDWYEQGKLLNKRNTFTDFIDVTAFLVAQKYADPQRVFATGASAGGLLMGAIVNMAPQSYRGVVARVPFVDVVTTMLDASIPLTTNEYDEWGDPRQKQYYDYMLSYSPYDNVQPQAYPAMFVATGLWDSQVQYYEPAKWVAKLRKLKTDRNPLLFRVSMEAGHGGKPGRFERYRETAEQYAFLLDQAGVRQ